MRVKLIIAYNGQHFLGSQVQPNTTQTVIGTLQVALQQLHIDEKLHASGRTDRGVHATGQVIHCDLPPYWKDLTKLCNRLNAHLPQSIIVKRIEKAADDFHARYSAKRRVYRYIISEKEANPFEADFVTFLGKPLSIEQLNRVLQIFIGTHDFSRFKKNGSGTTHYIRTIYKAHAYRHRGYIVLYYEANGYLRSQIRLMTGALLAVQSGKLTIEQVAELVACKATYRFKPAPPNGLYLARITY